jgi:hypothetical protein
MTLQLLLSVVLLAAGNPGVQVEARLTSSAAVAATAITLEVSANMPKELAVSPGWPARLGQFEILSTKESRPKVEGDRLMRRWELRLITFTAGRLEIPPITLIVNEGASGARGLVRSSPLNVTVQATTSPSPGAPLRLHVTTAVLPWTRVDSALGASGTIAGVLIWRAMRRRRKPTSSQALGTLTGGSFAAKKAPTLDDLRAALPMNAGQLQRFYDLADQVARGAIRSRTGVNAYCMCSRELADAVASTHGGGSEEWIDWLDRVDRVRFGRLSPPPSEPAHIVESLRQLVDGWSGSR